MGNPIVSDDAIGIRLATEFGRRLAAARAAAPTLAPAAHGRAEESATVGGPLDVPAIAGGPPHGPEIGPVHVIEECACGGLSILDMVVGYDRLIVLDAIKTRGGAPGTWYELTAGDLRETLHLRNVHDVNLATALALGRRLGLHLPADARVHIFAVEVEDVCTFAETMTPTLEAAYPELAEEIYRRVMALLESGSEAEGAGGAAI